MLSILQDMAKENRGAVDHFEYERFDDPVFKRRYSDYLLGEIKDHLTFYYGNDEYELFLKFFEILNGKAGFSHAEYLQKYKRFRDVIDLNDSKVPKFMSTAAAFLQFLYDLNVICYIERPKEDKPYVRWCFRERSYANISPKVKDGVEYQVFYGLYKALNVGKEFSHNA
jgi:hypothetical protein